MTTIAPAGFVRLVKTGGGTIARLRKLFAALDHQGVATLSVHQMRDIGVIDGRDTISAARQTHNEPPGSPGEPPRFL